MGARDRQTASRAAQSLMESLSRSAGDPMNLFEVIPGQARQLGSQLVSIAVDARLDVDIRACSLAGLKLLRAYDKTIGLKPHDISKLFEDEDVVVRQAALAAVEIPVSRNLLSQLAHMAGGEGDQRLRGQAAALLCENALAHGAKAPSKDLAGVLAAVLGNAEVPADGIGPIIGCLKRFPAESRADLFDIAVRHPDPAVGRFVKSLNSE
jgi:hypothetical protein